MDGDDRLLSGENEFTEAPCREAPVELRVRRAGHEHGRAEVFVQAFETGCEDRRTATRLYFAS